MSAEKGDNMGAGVPQGLFSQILIQVSGGTAKGTPAEQAALLLELVKEENAASHPGGGTTSMADAMLKYLAIAQAAQELNDAPAGPGPAQTAAIAKLAVAIHELGVLWATNGPVRNDAFLDSVKA
jgi:hypothetical protein